MTIHERFSYFVKSCYSSIENFAQEIGDKKENIYRYQNSSSVPTHPRLIKFQEAGMSIDWLLTGIGIMFAKNDKGVQLQKEFEGKKDTIGSKPFDRVKKWVEINFNSFSEFSVVMNIDHETLHLSLFDTYAMEIDTLRLLERAGCRIDWVKSGIGEEYANNPMGEILRSKKAQMLKELKDMDIKYYPAVYYYGEDQSKHIEKVVEERIRQKSKKQQKEKKK